MQFAGKQSHVRRLTKAESAERGIPYSRESYVVEKTYTDPFEGKVYREGSVVSNRQGRNVQAQEKGNYKSYSEYNRIWSPKARLTNKEVQARNAWIRKSTGSRQDADKLRRDTEFRKAWTQYYKISKQDRANKSPHGPLAQLLTAVGRRNANDKHNVGETPKGKK